MNNDEVKKSDGRSVRGATRPSVVQNTIRELSGGLVAAPTYEGQDSGTNVPVIGIGAGGHAKVIIDIIRSHYPQYEIIGLLDANHSLHETCMLGIRILGDDTFLSHERNHSVKHFFIGVGSIAPKNPRQKLYEQAVNVGMQPITIIHPSAVISSTAAIGSGVTAMPGVVVNAHASIGDNVILNTRSVVEHDCAIHAHVHIAPGACLGGAVTVGERTVVGMGAIIRQGVRIGADVMIGAGAVVVKDIPDGKTVIGNPARERELVCTYRKQ